MGFSSPPVPDEGGTPAPVPRWKPWADRWETLVRNGANPDSATAQVMRERDRADQWEALVQGGMTPEAATSRLTAEAAPPVQAAAPTLAAGMFGPQTLPRPVGPTGMALPAIGRTVTEEQAIANAPPLTGPVVHAQIQAQQQQDANDALAAQTDPNGIGRFLTGAASGAATQLGTLPTRAVHGLTTLGAATSALSAQAVGRPDVAHQIQMAALTGRSTAPVDAATARIGSAIARRLPVSGLPGQVGQFIGSQVPAVGAFELGLPEAEAGTPALGRIAQMGTAGGVAGLATQPENPAAGLEGVALGAGGEAVLRGGGALLDRLRGVPTLDVAPDGGMPPTGDRRAPPTVPQPPTSFRRRFGEFIDPTAADARINPVTKLPGAPLWAEMQPLADVHPDVEVVSADARNLGKINKQVSAAAGDQLIQAQADAFRRAVTEAGLDPNKVLFTPKGDELYATVPKGMGQAIGARAQELMGTPQFGDLSSGTRFGVGATTADADAAMNAAAAAEKAPQGAVEAPGAPPAPPVAEGGPPAPPANPESPWPRLDESGRIGVHHGSPHKFPPTPNNPLGEFDYGKIGTGEGAQSYGYGLYQAESPKTAAAYRRELGNQITIDGQPFFEHNKIVGTSGEGRYVDDLLVMHEGDVKQALEGEAKSQKDLQARLASAAYGPGASPNRIAIHRNLTTALADVNDAINALKRLQGRVQVSNSGALYHGEIDAEPEHFLDWDKPLSQQSPYVREHLKPFGVDGGNQEAAINHLLSLRSGRNVGTAGDFYRSLVADRGSPQAASTALKDAGIAGNRYLDAASRTKGTGTYNYVTFPGTRIDIIGREGQGASPIMGGLAGGIGGAAAGYATGTTDEERARNAILGGLGGAALGVGAGRLAEGATEARPMRTEGLPVGAPVTEGVQGPIRGPDATRIRNLDLSPEATARVENLARQVGPPGYESWNSLDAKVERARAQQVGLTAQDIAAWKRSGLDRVQIGAMNQVLLENQSRLDELAKVLTDPAASVEARTAAQAEKTILDRQSFDLFKSLKGGATGAGRDLAALRKTWSLVGDTDAAWQLRGQDVAGRPLTALEQTKLKAFRKAGDKAGALAYLGTLRPSGTVNQVLSQWKAGLLGLGAQAAKTVGDLTWAVTADAAKVPGATADWLMSLATRERTMAPTWNTMSRLTGAFGTEGRDAMRRALLGLPSRAEEAAGIVPQNTTVLARPQGIPKTAAEAAQLAQGRRAATFSRGVAGAHVGALVGAYRAGPGNRLKGAAEGAAIGGLTAAAIPQTQPILNGLFQGPFRLLKGISESAGMGAVRASLANQAEAIVRQAGIRGADRAATVAHLLTHPTEEMQLRAAADALYDTMTNPTTLSKGGRWVQSLPGGQVILPFNTTPASIGTKLLVDANPAVALPLGARRAMQAMRQGLRELATEGAVSPATKQLQQQAARYVGQGTVMTLPFAYGYWMASKGRASGTVDPTDRGERGLRSETGVPDDAFQRADGSWIKFTRSGLPGMIAALGANVYQVTHPDRAPEEAPPTVAGQALAGAQAMGRELVDQPFFVGVNQATQLASGDKSFGPRYVQGLERSVVPSVVRGLAAARDPLQRRVTDAGSAFTAGMPGQSSTLPPKRGMLGEPLPRMVQGAQALGSPVTVSHPPALDATAQPILAEWNRLGIPLSPPKAQPGESPAAYDQRMQQIGQTLRQVGPQVLGNAAYQTMSDADKADVWQKVLDELKGSSSKAARARVTSDSLKAVGGR